MYHNMNLLKQQDIVKLQIAKIMHDLHHSKFQCHYYNITNVKTVHGYEIRCSTNINYYQNQAKTEIGKKIIIMCWPEHMADYSKRPKTFVSKYL